MLNDRKTHFYKPCLYKYIYFVYISTALARLAVVIGLQQTVYKLREISHATLGTKNHLASHTMWTQFAESKWWRYLTEQCNDIQMFDTTPLNQQQQSNV